MNRDIVDPNNGIEQVTGYIRTGDLETPKPEMPRTVGEVLDLVSADPDHAYLCNTFNIFSKYLKVPDARAILLDQVSQRRHKFSAYLANHQYTQAKSVRHVHNVNDILKCAADKGWVPDENMSPAWRTLLEPAIALHCDDVLRDFDSDDISPDTVKIDHITKWVDTQVIERKHTFTAASARAFRFARLLRGSHLLQHPNPDPRFACDYGIALEHFPSPMKEETKRIAKSRVDGPDLIEDADLTGTWEDDTVRRIDKKEKKPAKPIRPISANLFVDATRRVYGIVSQLPGGADVDSLHQLFTKKHFDSSLEFLISRNLTSNSIRTFFIPLVTAIKYSTEFDDRDFVWLKAFVASLPRPTQAELEKWRARHHIDFSILEKVPEMIETDRKIVAARKTTTSGAQMFLSEKVKVYSARLFMRSLLIHWEILLPWRATNIVNCRLGTNLRREPLDLYSRVHAPAWVRKEAATNPKATFWMYFFSPLETKNGYSVAGYVPRPLVDPLNLFVDGGYRDILVGDKAVDNLFVSDHQSKLSYHDLRAILAELSLTYAPKRLSIHSFRYIFAFEYMRSRHADYRILSQCLWHHNPLTTMTYLTRFDISCSNKIVDSWYEERLSREEMGLADLPDFMPTYLKDQPPPLIFGERPLLAWRHTS
jgi:hypothetical protein